MHTPTPTFSYSNLRASRSAFRQRAQTTRPSFRDWLGALALASVLAASPGAIQAQGTGTFIGGDEAQVGFDPRRLVSGDFNRDGFTDIATLHRGRSIISLMHGNGDGSIGTPVEMATSPTPLEFFAGDSTRDARDDFVTVGATVGISRGIGNGRFAAPSSTAVGAPVFTSALGDFNEDGRTDLITITGAGLRLLSGSGLSFNPPGAAIPALSAGAAMVAGDFNRDTHLDVAFTRFGQSTTVGVMLGNGNGTFQSQQVFITGETPLDVVTADFNRDGFLDLAVLTLSGTRPLAILLNNRLGGFQLPSHPRVTKPDQIAIADMDHNGVDDIVMLSRGQRRIEVLRSLGNGAFATTADLATTIPGTIQIGEFTTALLNRDAFPDLAVTVRHPNDPNLGLVVTFLNPGEPRRVEGLVNISTRLLIEHGSTVVTGFVIEGKATTVLIRAVGPGLRQFGLNNVIADPNLSIFRGNTRIGGNDNWSAAVANRTAVEAATTEAGAFPLTVGSNDAATVLTLAPGAYTIVTATTPGANGEVMVEVYRAGGN